MVPPMVKSRPEDVPQKAGQALRCGMPESETARHLGVSSLRTSATREPLVGEGLSGRRRRTSPKVDRSTEKLLEKDLRELPGSTDAHRWCYLKHLTGTQPSEVVGTTVRRRTPGPSLRAPFVEGRATRCLGPHDLRHTCVTILLMAGKQPKHVRELLAHTSHNHHARRPLLRDRGVGWQSHERRALGELLLPHCCHRGLRLDPDDGFSA
jgi:hypothetical protein